MLVLTGKWLGKLDVPDNRLWLCAECHERRCEELPLTVFRLREENLAFLVRRLGEHGTYDYLHRRYADTLYHRRIYRWRLSDDKPPLTARRFLKQLRAA